LITDFSAYNTDVVYPPEYGSRSYAQSSEGGYHSYGRGYGADTGPAPEPGKLGLHWVGDLAVECTIDVQSETGEAFFELVEGGVLFACRIDVATGLAKLSIDGHDQFRPTAQTRVRGCGVYRIMFSNVDDQLLLWVNGSPVPFHGPTTFPPLGNVQPTPEDLVPVRIGSRRAKLKVSHLKVRRDIYYIAARATNGSSPIVDYDLSRYLSHTGGEIARLFSSPEAWRAFASRRIVAFPLREDQFLALGDNSAESKDSRLWEKHYVSRELLIGKALIIYWPHGWDIPGIDLPVKVVPNIWRIMRFVR
jgi:signal peptidase I